MIREIKRLISIAFILAVLAVIVLIFTVLWPAFVTTTTEYSYTHEAADTVNITVLCSTIHDCNVLVLNSTSDKINVTIKTTAPISAEYKGSQKVADAFQRNVTFTQDGVNMDVTIRIIGGDEMFQFTPSTASVIIYVPEGTHYKLNKKWPY